MSAYIRPFCSHSSGRLSIQTHIRLFSSLKYSYRRKHTNHILGNAQGMMSGSNTVEFVDAENLVKLIKDQTKEPGKDYLIIDVRDEDFKSGHIPGAINIPSHTMADEVNSLIDTYGQVPQIFFHCALSQRRGPSSARVYSEMLSQKSTKTSQKVQILRGGFVLWQEKYKDDPELVADYDKDVWEEMVYY